MPLFTASFAAAKTGRLGICFSLAAKSKIFAPPGGFSENFYNIVLTKIAPPFNKNVRGILRGMESSFNSEPGGWRRAADGIMAGTGQG
jgi:hypothetical protein